MKECRISCHNWFLLRIVISEEAKVKIEVISHASFLNPVSWASTREVSARYCRIRNFMILNLNMHNFVLQKCVELLCMTDLSVSDRSFFLNKGRRPPIWRYGSFNPADKGIPETTVSLIIFNSLKVLFFLNTTLYHSFACGLRGVLYNCKKCVVLKLICICFMKFCVDLKLCIVTWGDHSNWDDTHIHVVRAGDLLWY